MEIPANNVVAAQSGQSSRYVQLDALRGIAAMMVVYAHSVEFRSTGVASTSSAIVLWRLLDWGVVGVAAFFCISGFVVPYSFGKRAQPARAFVISRFARLYPAYWCSILAAVAAAYVQRRQWIPPLTLLANATMLQRLAGQPDIWGVYWTLFIEILFYTICLAAFLAGCLRSIVFLFLAALICLGLAAGSAVLLPSAVVPAMSLSLMLLACLWRKFIIERDGQAARLTAIGITVWLLFLITMANQIRADGIRLTESWVLGIAIFAVLTIVRVRPPGALIYLGAISYGVYLYHELVSGVVNRLLPAWANSPYPGFILTAFGSIGVAAISYKVLEHPCIMLGKALGDRAPSPARVPSLRL
jgi:peptidoglycan/LPS O-acetylase OafA/YrhL